MPRTLPKFSTVGPPVSVGWSVCRSVSLSVCCLLSVVKSDLYKSSRVTVLTVVIVVTVVIVITVVTELTVVTVVKVMTEMTKLTVMKIRGKN